MPALSRRSRGGLPAPEGIVTTFVPARQISNGRVRYRRRKPALPGAISSRATSWRISSPTVTVCSSRAVNAGRIRSSFANARSPAPSAAAAPARRMEVAARTARMGLFSRAPMVVSNASV